MLSHGYMLLVILTNLINQKEFRTVKVIKRKGDKLYVKWKGYDNSFYTWIDKKRYCYVNFFSTL